MRSPGAAFDLRAALSQETRAALDEIERADDPKALHRCRLHIKRARALARVGHACAPGLASVFNDTARGVMRTLGHARDQSALAETAGKLARKLRSKDAKTFKAMKEVLAADGADIRAPNFEAAHTGLKDLLALAQVWPEVSPRQIKRGGDRIARRARKAHVAAQDTTDTLARHEWRKREKDRLYAASLLGSAWRLPSRLKRGEKLTELLGKERDTRMLLERLRAQPGLAGCDKAALRAERLLIAKGERLARKADRAGAKLHTGHA